MSKRSSLVIGLSLVFLWVGMSEAVKLGSVFTRAFVSGKGSTYNTGFTVWDQPHRVLIRVLGPSVKSAFGNVANDPGVKVYDINLNLLASNGDWVKNTNKQEIEQTGLAPQFNQEAALIMTLNPGLYSVEVFSEDGSEGNILLEMYDLGELRVLYDDFSASTIDTQKWDILTGNPIIDENYLKCNSNIRDTASGRYLCMIKSTGESFGWGVAVQTVSSPKGPLGIRRCAGQLDGSLVCGEFLVQTNSDVIARIVKYNNEADLFGTIIFSEKITHLVSGVFLSVDFSAESNLFSFFAVPQGSEAITTISKAIGGMTDKLKKAPLLIYSYSSIPLTSSFLVSYVEY